MMKFFGKSKSAAKKRLEKDARLLRANAESIYWSELSKPSEERDEQLIEECLSIIKQSSGILLGEKQYHYTVGFYGLRRVAVTIAVILAVAAAAGVVYAGGSALWNVFFKSDNQSIKIDGQTNDEVSADNQIDFDSIPEYNRYKVDSIDQGAEYLNIKIRNLDLTKRGYMIDNIYITKNDVFMELNIRWTKADKYADIAIQVYNGGAHTAYVTELLGSFNKTETRQIAGADIYIGAGDEVNAICWMDGEYIYQIYSNGDADMLLECIEEELNRG